MDKRTLDNDESYVSDREHFQRWVLIVYPMISQFALASAQYASHGNSALALLVRVAWVVSMSDRVALTVDVQRSWVSARPWAAERRFPSAIH